MRTLIVVIGIVLISLGTLIVSGRPTVRTERNVLEVGEFKATVQEEQRALPPWVGVLGIAGGVLIVLLGPRSVRRRPAGG
jgi:hypothetical protein